MKLRAYLHFGVGDTWETREFLRDWMVILGVNECEVACRFPCVYEDMPQIHPIEFTPEMNMRKGWFWKEDTFYLNLWIGCRNAETIPSGDYVLWPGVGCTVENLYRMHNQYLKEAGLSPLFRSVVDYIPNVDYSRIDTSRVDEFLRFASPHRKVLVCNGPTGSGHAENFDMVDMVSNHLSNIDNTLFIFTGSFYSPISAGKWPNTDSITGRQPGECDVLKISYLSRFCDVIVGRCSGAQMPCETRENWLNPKKTLVSFTQHRNGACFVRNPEALGLQMKLVHSPASTPQEAAEVLRSVL